MTQTEFIAAVSAAKKVFVWVQLTNKRACYLQVMKSAIYELLNGCADAGDDWHAFMENGELLIGEPSED